MNLPWNRPVDPNDVDAEFKVNVRMFTYVLIRMALLAALAGILYAWVHGGGEGLLAGLAWVFGIGTALVGLAFLIYCVGNS